MITIDNIFSEYPRFEQSALPAALKANEFEFLEQNIDLYNDDETIKEFIDTFVLKLNEFAGKSKTTDAEKNNEAEEMKPKKAKAKKDKAVKPQKTKTARPKKEKVAKPKKEKKVKPQPENLVAKMPVSVMFLKRYRNLHNKTIARAQLLSLIRGLQKAIVEKQIRKTDPHAAAIETIQKNLVTTYRETIHHNEIKIEIAETTIDELTRVIKAYEIEKPIAIIKRFLSIQGRQNVEKQADLLLKSIEKNYDNYSDVEYGNALNTIKTALQKYLNDNTITLAISEATLKGLAGLVGCSLAGTKKKTALSGVQNDRVSIINSTELANKSFKKAGWTGKWLKLIGDPVEPFSIMVWSKPGKGKSTLIIELSYYLASEKGKKILYISLDEGSSYTMQEKFSRLNAFHPNIDISSGIIPSDLAQYDYVVFDLMNDFNFKYEDFKTNFIDKYFPLGVSFISIFKTNVNGEYRGNKDWENLFDVSINIDDEGVAKANKNRFGVFNELKVF